MQGCLFGVLGLGPGCKGKVPDPEVRVGIYNFWGSKIIKEKA